MLGQHSLGLARNSLVLRTGLRTGMHQIWQGNVYATDYNPSLFSFHASFPAAQDFWSTLEKKAEKKNGPGRVLNSTSNVRCMRAKVYMKKQNDPMVWSRAQWFDHGNRQTLCFVQNTKQKHLMHLLPLHTKMKQKKLQCISKSVSVEAIFFLVPWL